ncbi:unnamed protein product [Phytophthora fragariaefolia]|uniref:Unnamed protein product n=1 Tax=Phytophthora fragariaefolia TaxID=1490495 RepID=A0A9W6TJF3_9STRA|nr:unnamed protein product [Phytophthora fragariaefolia]
MEGDGRERPQEKVSGSGGCGASRTDKMLPDAAPGGGGRVIAGAMMAANAGDRMLTDVAYRGGGGGVETGFVPLLNGAVASGGVCGEGPDVHAVTDGADDASSSAAPKRTRGRPKGSKNKPKVAIGPESKRKRGRLVGSKASPKRSLAQAMGSAEADVPPDIRIPQQEDSAATSVTVNTNESDTDELPGTIVPRGEGANTQVEGDIDDEECMEMLDPPTELPTSLSDVEATRNMRFEPGAPSEEPENLYWHMDGTTTTRLLSKFKHIFEHSASASFFAYIPLSFWQQVVGETNIYARMNDIAVTTPFTLDEVMAFLGVLFYMELVDKGECSNYWGQLVEDAIFGGSSVRLDAVMPLRRFKQLRQAFCFRCIEVSSGNRDQAVRIRPLLNLLKVTGPKYVEVRRNVALDEASIACRTKYGKPLVVYNPMKPTGKCHFRIYMLCCSATWIS